MGLQAARVVELVDARDSKSRAARRAGSIPAPGTSSFFLANPFLIANRHAWLAAMTKWFDSGPRHQQLLFIKPLFSSLYGLRDRAKDAIGIVAGSSR